MLKLRLKRFGRKGRPSYRIVVMDSKNKRDGKSIEELGYYNPISKKVYLNELRIEKRLAEGIQPTSTIKQILVGSKIYLNKKDFSEI